VTVPVGVKGLPLTVVVSRTDSPATPVGGPRVRASRMAVSAPALPWLMARGSAALVDGL